MSRDTRRQVNKSALERQLDQGKSRPAVSMRSPALVSLEQQQAGRRAEAQQRLNAQRKPQHAASGRAMRYAAEESAARPVAPRKKSLPPMVSRAVKTGKAGKASVAMIDPRAQRTRTGFTVGWRLRSLWTSEEQEAGVQAINEEEQKKLSELEMSLPRVAGKIDSWLLTLVLILLCIGMVMVYSASSFMAARYEGDASYYFQRELIWVILGMVALLVTMRVDYRQWRRYSLIGMVIILPLLVIVLKFGVTVYGASRWLALGSFFSFQPSELTKLVLALYIADWLARKGNQVGTFLYGLAPFVILVGIVLGLVLLENDMGTAVVIAGFATVMFFTAGANITQFLLAMGCGGLIFLREAFNSYRYFRLLGFLNPFKNITSINLQLYQALLAFGSGGWFGLGLGASRQKTGYLPFPYTDSIFPIIGEELGFLGCACIVVLFLFLAFRGFRLARRTPDLYGSLLATGITTWLILQAMVNIGANTGTIPYTGVPLPFISFGGSSLVVSMAAVGVLLNISRYIQEPENPAFSRNTIATNLKRKFVGA